MSKQFQIETILNLNNYTPTKSHVATSVATQEFITTTEY